MIICWEEGQTIQPNNSIWHCEKNEKWWKMILEAFLQIVLLVTKDRQLSDIKKWREIPLNAFLQILHLWWSTTWSSVKWHLWEICWKMMKYFYDKMMSSYDYTLIWFGAPHNLKVTHSFQFTTTPFWWHHLGFEY